MRILRRALLALAAPVLAGFAGSDVSGLVLRDQVLGPPLKVEDLAGKVVVYDLSEPT